MELPVLPEDKFKELHGQAYRQNISDELTFVETLAQKLSEEYQKMGIRSELIKSFRSIFYSIINEENGLKIIEDPNECIKRFYKKIDELKKGFLDIMDSDEFGLSDQAFESAHKQTNKIGTMTFIPDFAKELVNSGMRIQGKSKEETELLLKKMLEEINANEINGKITGIEILRDCNKCKNGLYHKLRKNSLIPSKK